MLGYLGKQILSSLLLFHKFVLIPWATSLKQDPRFMITDTKVSGAESVPCEVMIRVCDLTVVRKVSTRAAAVDQMRPCCFSWRCSSGYICQHRAGVTLPPPALALESQTVRLLAQSMGAN